MKNLYQINKKTFKLTFYFLILALLLIATHHLKVGVLLGLLGLGFTFIFTPITIPESIKIPGAKRSPLVTRIIGAILLIAAILTLHLGLFNQVVIQEDENKLLKYNFYYINKSKVYSILSKQRYSYSQAIDTKYISVITLNSFKANVKEYKITKDGTTNIIIPKDKDFIISLHANRTIVAEWIIKNNLDKNIIKFNECMWMVMQTPFSDKDKSGINYDRQNLYFKALKEGTTNLILRYECEETANNNYFETNLNITIK